LFARRKHQNRNQQEELHLELEKVRAQEKALVGLQPTKGNQVAVVDRTILRSNFMMRLGIISTERPTSPLLTVIEKYLKQ